MYRLAICAFLAFATLTQVSCVSVPKIEGDIAAQLDQLEAANKPMQEISNPVLAGVLNIFPGVGQMYAGDFGDGVLTLLTFWLAVPYYMGFVDAVQEARVANAKYTIQYYKKQGFKFSLGIFKDESNTKLATWVLFPEKNAASNTDIYSVGTENEFR